MLHVINRHSHGESAVLAAMFAARKRVFVDLLRWDVPILGGTWELDQFDNEDASYLVITDGAHRHLASARLLPANRPHILDTLFPHLCETAPPVCSQTWEITRFCLDRSLSADNRRRARNQLVTALVHHALDQGITRFTAVAELAWSLQIQDFGWRCRALGPTEGTLVALAIEIDAGTPARLSEAGIFLAIDGAPLARAA